MHHIIVLRLKQDGFLLKLYWNSSIIFYNKFTRMLKFISNYVSTAASTVVAGWHVKYLLTGAPGGSFPLDTMLTTNMIIYVKALFNSHKNVDTTGPTILSQSHRYNSKVVHFKLLIIININFSSVTYTPINLVFIIIIID